MKQNRYAAERYFSFALAALLLVGCGTHKMSDSEYEQYLATDQAACMPGEHAMNVTVRIMYYHGTRYGEFVDYDCYDSRGKWMSGNSGGTGGATCRVIGDWRKHKNDICDETNPGFIPPEKP